mmetsp:Transcript_15827/g.36723  ORF Transcript_15827/g.36723 Transcript_15827/m.36723 type:complete len:253 (-) Transcript_15827:428-1186(-)
MHRDTSSVRRGRDRPGPPPAAARRLSTSPQARARLRIPETRPPPRRAPVLRAAPGPPLSAPAPAPPRAPHTRLDCAAARRRSARVPAPPAPPCLLRRPTHPGPGPGTRPRGPRAPASRGIAGHGPVRSAVPSGRRARASAAGPPRTAPFSGRWSSLPWPLAPARGAGRTRPPPRRHGTAGVESHLHSSLVSWLQRGTGALSQARVARPHAARPQAGRHLLSCAAPRFPWACPGPASTCPASAPAPPPARRPP